MTWKLCTAGMLAAMLLATGPAGPLRGLRINDGAGRQGSRLPRSHAP